MLQHIKLLPLVIGLIVGAVGIYFIKPDKTVVLKYPNPDNHKSLTYKDKNGMCYKYDVAKVECDKNENRLKKYPLM